MDDKGRDDAGASFDNPEAEIPFSLDRREVVVGLAAGALLATKPAGAADSAIAPDIRLIRNPEKHDEIGVAIDFGLGPDAVAIAFYAKNMAAKARPQGFAGAKTALDKLDRFAFDDVRFSHNRGAYRLELSFSVLNDEWMVTGSFSRKSKKQATSKEPVKLIEFAQGKAELQFELDIDQAELFRWDLFGERLAVKGKGAILGLKLSSLAPARGSLSPWSEAQLRFSLAPRPDSSIWAIKGTVSVNKLLIRQTRGDKGDGSRIQETQEFAKLKVNKSYQANAWLGEANELAWRFPPVPPAGAKLEPEGDKTVLRPVPEKYFIVDTDAVRKTPVIAITHDAPPTKLTLRQWGGDARATVAALRVPLKVTILGPLEQGKPKPPPAVFHLADALLMRQDIGVAPKALTGPGDVPGEAIEETLSGRLREKAFAVDTVYGTFIVEGDPLPKRKDASNNSGDKPGSASKAAGQKQPTGAAGAAPPAAAPAEKSDKADKPKSAFGEELDQPSGFADRPEKGLTQFQLRARGGDIFFFDARAQLRQICVVLPDAMPRPNADKPPVSWSKRESAVWSRLDFDGSEIAFRIDLPEDPKTADFSLRRAWPSARGVVTLCELPRSLQDLSTLAKMEAREEPRGTKNEKETGKEKGAGKKPKNTEPQGERPAPVVIALDGARLRARRDSDNLALTFQFACMALELGLGGGRIVANAKLSGGGIGQTAKSVDGARKFDDRPLLIVNFPPQHVAEMAYYRQVNDGVALPDVLGHLRDDQDFKKGLKDWRTALPGSGKDDERKKVFTSERTKATGQTTEEEKAAMRGLDEIVALTKGGGDKVDWQSKLGLKPADFEKLWNTWAALPPDQRQYYLGTSADAIDPDVRKVLLQVWRAHRAANPDVARPGNDDEKAESKFQELLARLPDVDLSGDVENDIEARLSVADSKDDPKKDLPADRTDRIIKEKAKRSNDFVLVSRMYAETTDVPRPIDLPAQYSGREEIRKTWKAKKDGRDAISNFVRGVVRSYEEEAFGEKERFKPITPARLSGPSRLVFRFDAAGGSYDDPDRDKRSSLGEDQEQVRSIHFSFEGLTNWGRFDLAVARRAETLELQPGGRVPHASMRALDLDPQRILLHQGIQPERSIDGRMRDILASLQPPTQDETAIELPFRLVLSPDQFGRFRTRRVVEPGVVRETDPKPDRDEQLSELWTANLQVGAARPVVRAIWSDDFLPGALDGGPSPVRGPYAPWEVPAKGVEGATPFRTALDAYDRHEIVALSSVYGLPVMGRRNELNNLIDASQFEPPKSYKLDRLKQYPLGGGRTDDLSGIYNPSSLNVTELRLTALGGSLRHDTTFIPPASAIRLLKGKEKDKEKNIFDAFTIERWRQITVLGRDIEVEVVYKGFLFPLGVRATLVKLTERLFMRAGDGPVTAFLVQRKFIRIGKKTKEYPAVGEADRGYRFPVNELTMLTLETPDIVDPDILDSADMIAASDKAIPGVEKLGFRVRPNGTIDFTRDNSSRELADFFPGLCFWPRLRPSEAGNFNFEFRVENDATPLRMPMIFVDNRAANNQDTMAALTAYYNGIIGKNPSGRENLALRTVRMGGASRRYADENKDGECHFETFSWEIRGEGRVGNDTDKRPNAYFASDPLLQGSDQPPFYPYIHRARIRVGQAERFVGRPLDPQWVRFYDGYRKAGFTGTERYLEIVAEVDTPKPEDEEKIVLPLDMGEAGDRSGGIGRPAMNLKFLSRRFGLLPAGDELIPKTVDAPQSGTATGVGGQETTPGEPPPPPPPKFDLKSFFSGDAKLLGLLTFSELLETIAGSAMPELKEQVDAATEQTAGFLKQTVLPEVERSLKSLEQMWETAQRKLSSQAAAAGDVVRLDINEIYPDIAPALKNLIGKVKQAETVSGLDLVGAMSEVQTSGRKFVTAVSRTLADPVTPLREDLRGQFRKISIEINKFGAGLPALIEGALKDIVTAQVEKFEENIAVKLKERIAKIKPFTRLVLSLPVPEDVDLGLSDTAKQELAETLDHALAVGVIKLAVTVMKPETLAKNTLDAALVAAIEAAKNDLETNNQALKGAIAAYKKQAEDFIAEANSAAGEAQQQVLRRVKGALYPGLFETIGLIPELKRQFESLVGKIKAANGRDLLEIAADHIGAAMKAMLTELIQSKASELCNNLVSDIAKLADQVLIPAKATADRTDIIKLADAVKKFVSVFPLDNNPTSEATKLKDQFEAIDKRAANAIKRYKEIRGRLTEAGLRDVCNVAPGKSAIAVQLAGELNELMALKQVVGQWVVAALRLCEQNLTDKVKRTELNSQGLWELFKTALNSSDPKKEVNDLIKQLVGFVGATDVVRTTWTNVFNIVREMSAANAAAKDALATIGKEIAPFPAILEKIQAAIKLAEDKDPLDAMRVAIVVLDGVKDRTSDELYKRISSSLTKELEKKEGEQELYAFIFDPNERARGVVRIVDGVDRQLRSLLGKALTNVDGTRRAMIETIGRAAAPIFVALNDTVYKNVATLRRDGIEALTPGQDPSKSTLRQIVAKLLKVLRAPNGQPLQDLFAVPGADGKDKLESDIKRVASLAEFGAGTDVTDAAIDSYVADLAALADDWTNGTAAPLVLLNNLRAVLAAVLKGDLAQFVDLNLIRQQVDQAIRTMVPARISRSFDLKIKVKDLGKLVLFEGKEANAKALGLPKQHPKGIPLTLVLRATGIVDLLEPKNSTFDAEGYLPGFALQLLPSFDVATFSFPPTTFTAGLGKPFHVSLKVEDVKLGEKVKFLQDIQSILPAPKSGKGFFIRMLKGRGSLGIVAGYALPISPITIGNMFIDQLSLNIAAELPFDKGDARFIMSVSRPEAPFVIALAPYAGAGHFGLIANPKGIVGFEASFQFGGGGGFSFGPLTGKGRISVGVFVRKIEGLTELYGTFYVGGSARIACFAVGAELYVRLSHQNGDMAGEAIFTFSFSIGVKDIEYSVTVFKRESGSSSKSEGSLDDRKTIDLAADEFREVYAQAGTPAAPLPGTSLKCARLVNATFCKAEDYDVYRSYFSHPGTVRKPPERVKTAKPAAPAQSKGKGKKSGGAAATKTSTKVSAWVMK